MEEKRILQEAPVVIRSADGEQDSGRTVRGYAAVFSSVSEDLGFREVLAPGCIDQDTIKRSTVLARVNHDSGKVVAKCKNGEGSLKLEVDERGLKYEFESPRTATGDELLELIERGDISQSSFAFTIAEGGDEWRYADGEYLRTITKVDRLYDVAPVFMPAYESTECTRCANVLERHKSRMEAHRTHLESLQAEDSEILEWTEAVRTIYAKCDQEVRELTKDESDEVERLHQKVQNKKVLLQAEAEEIKRTKKNKKTEEMTEVNKRFSILRAIVDVVNKREMSAETKAVVEYAQGLNRGLQMSGELQIPMEGRALTVASDGANAVGVEVQSINEALRAETVLAKAGATFLTGLTDNVRIPVLTGATSFWEGETGKPTSNAGTGIAKKDLAPVRITSYLPISKQLLIQSNENLEAVFMQDLINSIWTALEGKVLSADAATSVVKAGLFNVASGTIQSVSDFKGICTLESQVDDSNVKGEKKYIVSNKAKALLRAMSKSTKSTELVMQNGTIDGTEVLASSNVTGNGIAYGNWAELVIAQWGAMDITVDNVTLAANGQIQLIVNTYWDFGVRHAVAQKAGDTGVIAVAAVSATA